MSDFDAPIQAPDLHVETRHGREADRLLNDEAFQRGMTGMTNATVDALRDCPIGSQDRLNYLHLMLRVIKDFEGNLREVIETGKLAVRMIDAQDAQAKRNQKRAADLGISVADLQENY